MTSRPGGLYLLLAVGFNVRTESLPTIAILTQHTPPTLPTLPIPPLINNTSSNTTSSSLLGESSSSSSSSSNNQQHRFTPIELPIVTLDPTTQVTYDSPHTNILESQVLLGYISLLDPSGQHHIKVVLYMHEPDVQVPTRWIEWFDGLQAARKALEGS